MKYNRMVTLAGFASSLYSIESAPKHGKSDLGFLSTKKVVIFNNKPTKKRLKVKLARKANVQRLIKNKKPRKLNQRDLKRADTF